MNVAIVEFHVRRCMSNFCLVSRPFFDCRPLLPNGSLQSAWMVSPPSNRAAALEGANFLTVSEPAKKLINASVTLETAVLPVPPGPTMARCIVLKSIALFALPDACIL